MGEKDNAINLFGEQRALTDDEIQAYKDMLRRKENNMGVYIKEMEMPNSCEECRFYIDKWCYAYTDSNGSRFKYLGDSRPCFCPLSSLESQGTLNCKPTAIKSTEVPWWILEAEE